jgi:hypothetical protein
MSAERVPEKRPKLTPAEESRLAWCEDYIGARMASVFEIGEKLAIIRDERLYREEYDTFKEYLADKWHLSPQTAYFQIAHVETKKVLAMSPRGDISPASASFTKPLHALPDDLKKEAWSEAVKDAGGVHPTKRQVQDAANKVSPPLKRSAERPAKPVGDSDADVQAARDTGIIPADADVETDDPQREYYGAKPEEKPEPEVFVAASQTDDEWLDSLPLSRELRKESLASFRRSALGYRRTRARTVAYREGIREDTKDLRRGPGGGAMAWDWMLHRINTLNPPDRWESCGTCRGTGSCASGGCPTCHSHGYICN